MTVALKSKEPFSRSQASYARINNDLARRLTPRQKGISFCFDGGAESFGARTRLGTSFGDTSEVLRGGSRFLEKGCGAKQNKPGLQGKPA